MSGRGTLRARAVAQFGHPSGMLGRIAGAVMARRPSNRERNAWTVRLLDLARRRCSGDRVRAGAVHRARGPARVARPGGRRRPLGPDAPAGEPAQPRGGGASNAQARAAGAAMADALRASGFRAVEVHTLPLAPVDAVCAVGRR
jgi:hypothetical protein